MTTYRVTGHIGEDGLFTARLPEGVAPGEVTAEVTVEPLAFEDRVERLALAYGEDNWLVKIYRSPAFTPEFRETMRGASDALIRERAEVDERDVHLYGRALAEGGRSEEDGN